MTRLQGGAQNGKAPISGPFRLQLRFSWRGRATRRPALSALHFVCRYSEITERCNVMTREDAWKLLCEYTKGESLRKHALAVEAVMRAYARRLNEDEDKWAIVGMLHDFDYEMYPNPPDHPVKGSEILKERGYSEEIRKAILGHANYTGVARDTLLARALYACDELTGFVVACALVRPNGIWDLESKSVKKKLKDKAFARTVNRDEVYEGAQELAIDLGEHIDFIIASLREVAPEVGLK